MKLVSGACTAWLVLANAVVAPLTGQNLREPGFMVRAEEGFAYIRNLDYDLADETFARLQSEHRTHPAPPLYRAVVIWLRELFDREELDLDRFISPGYFTKPARQTMALERRKAFDDFIRQCQEGSRAILSQDPKHADARYFLGASYGVLAAFTFTIDRSYLRAFRHGKEAHRYQKALVEENPRYYDAYMSVGLYEYIAASVPWYIKWLTALIGYRGSKDQGLRYLSLAAEHGQYVADDARVLQMVLFVREKQHEKALMIAGRLHRAFLRNYILHLNQAQILEKMGRAGQAAERYREVMELAEAGRPNYHRLPLPRFRYTIGKKLMDLGDPHAALEQFEEAVQDPATPERERALSHLRAGQILDLAGQRDDATAHYNAVLRLREFDDSHALARRFLRRPYRAERGNH